MYGKVERWKKKRGGKLKNKLKKKEIAAPCSSKNFHTLNIQTLLRNAARRRTNACSKYNIHQVHLFSFTEFRKRFLVVHLG